MPWEAEAASPVVFDFEDLSLPADSFHSGHPDGPNHPALGEPAPAVGDYSNKWSNGSGVKFDNLFSVIDFAGSLFQAWTGFALSSKTDSTTPGFTNQYSAIPGKGANGSQTYGVGFPGAEVSNNASFVHFDQPAAVQSIDVTNTTYAYRAIVDGKADGFLEPPPFADGDYFLLTITGKDKAGATTGSVDFYLADYRDVGSPVAVNNWQSVDLKSLGKVSTLEFSLTSSDVSGPYIDTPAYFAVDNLVFTTGSRAVPEPSTALLAALGLVFLGRFGFAKSVAKRRGQRI
jgi:hypothetical protein